MMDIYCPNCNEPVDMDYLHDIVSERRADGDTGASFDTVARDYRRRGCPAIGTDCNPSTVGHPATSLLYELLGDDMDGAAAMMDDMDMMDLNGWI